MSQLDNIRIATTEAGLSNGYLVYSWHIPEPSLPIYSDHTARQNKQNGGVALRGFSSVTMQFEGLTTMQIRLLKSLVEDSIASADKLMYATVNRSWGGLGPTNDWIDIKGHPSISAIAPLANTKALIADGVTLTINNITIVNDPWTP